MRLYYLHGEKKKNKWNVLEINSNMLFGEQQRNHLSTRYILQQVYQLIHEIKK